MTSGISLAHLDGKFDVELLFGENEDEMRSLVRIPKAKARDSWKGALPAQSGFVRAVFSEGSRFYFGEPTDVCTGTDLLGKPGPQAPAAADGQMKSVEGGPIPGGMFLSYQSDSARRNGQQRKIALRRAELKPGKEYVLSGWFRPAEDSQLQLSVQFLGSDSKPMTSAATMTSISGNRGFWAYRSLRLSQPRRNDGESRYTIPAGAAFAEVIVETSPGFDVAALSLVEAPVQKADESSGRFPFP